MQATPKAVAALISFMELCLDDEAVIRKRGRGFSEAERRQWHWLDDALDCPHVRCAMVGLGRERQRYLESLLRDYAAAVHPDEQPKEEEQPLLFPTGDVA